MAERDFRDAQGNLPAEVGFRNIHPMWSCPPTAVNANYVHLLSAWMQVISARIRSTIEMLYLLNARLLS